MDQTDSEAAALIGTVLGDAYRLTRLLGRGGMGAVFEAVQLRLNKRVAVKLMTRELAANGEALARFRREAEVTSQLGHPHIVQVFDFGQAPSGEPYLVMEFLEGEDLEQRLRRTGRMSLADTSHIIKQVASALSATHASGIVHRDLKPANIFILRVDDTDFVKVVDFGISKVRAATTKLTAAAVVMGTPIYMSPEQAEGRVDEIDHRTDQWALGCIAYELLAGRPPFMGENVASLLYQVVHQAPPAMVPKVPEVSPDLEQVLGVALAKRLEDRFGSMTAFARAFESAAAGRPVTALVAAPTVANAATAVAVLPEAPPRTPAAIPQQTTFSTAAGEAVEPVERPARQGKRLIILGAAGVALLLGAGALFAMRGQTPATPGPAVGVAPSLAPTPPPPPTPTPPTPTPPTTVPKPVAADEEKARAPQPALVTAPAARPKKEKIKKPRSNPAAAAPGSDPTGDSAQVRSPPPAAPPPEPQPAWPPPAQSPPPQQQFQPAWPPPPDNTQDLTAPPPKAKKKGLFKRIFGKDN